jgi:hypothetical protein
MSDEIYHKTFEDLYYESEIVNNRQKQEIQKLKADREVMVEALKLVLEWGEDVMEDRAADSAFWWDCGDEVKRTLKSIGEIE